MLIGADLPEGHPTRVAAITRHAQDFRSPVPGRQARGQQNLARMNLSPSEHFAFNLPAAPAHQSVPVQTITPPLMPEPITTNMGSREINQAVNHFSNHLPANLKLPKGFEHFDFRGDPLGNATPVLAHRIVGLAHEFLGTPYLWGGRTPKGFDCSGFAQFLYGKVGISIPPTTYTQWQAGSAVPKRALQPGDLVFFRGSDSIGGLPGHVGVYIGHGMMIDAPHTGARVRVESVHNFGGYMGARRYGKG